jgi:transcriptional regulator with XRE-family HTH domain
MGMTRRRSVKLSDQIRRAIKTCGKTRAQISRETGVDQATLCRFVQGRHGLLLESLDRVAECIGLRVVLEKQPTTKKGK